MEEICSIEKCTGCALCMNVCPVNAIHMEYNNYGILFPIIEWKKCIGCNKCRKYCSDKNIVFDFYPNNKVYAVYAKNKKERKSSTSGGMAAIFYRNIIANGGYGVGAIFHNQTVKMSLIKNEKDILRAKGSKYVQAEVNKIYMEVQDRLHDGKKVLFIGTPCQVGAVKAFVGETQNLITVDLICHGVPSRKYMLEHLEKLLQDKKCKEITFREGGKVFFLVMGMCGRTLYRGNERNDNYVKAFLKGISYRESCFQCTYAQNKRVSDITIGDFWGIGRKELYPHNRFRGVSLVLLHTDKGKRFFDLCEKDCNVMERTIEEAIEENEQLNRPSNRPLEREIFLEAYPEAGFDKAVELAIGKDKEKIYVFLIKHFILKIQDVIKALLGPVILFYIKKKIIDKFKKGRK